MTSANRFGVWIALVAWTAVCHVGCDRANPANQSGPKPAGPAANAVIKIVTTTGMVRDIVRRVAGPRADVSGLIESGVDPHLFKPTRGDIKQLHDADVVFYSGLMLEGKMSEQFTQLQRAGKPVFAVTESLDKDSLRSPPDFEGHYDPHVWMDVKAWSQCVEHVAQSLATFDPPHADEYRANAKSYREELAKLDAIRPREVLERIMGRH